jgi:hypothetical protein
MTLAWSPDSTHVAYGGDGGAVIVDVASGTSNRIRSGRGTPRVGWIDNDTLILEETR